MKKQNKQNPTSNPRSSKPTQGTWLIGKHAVLAALNANRRQVHELWLGPRYADTPPAVPEGCKILERDGKVFDEKFPNRPHQHMAAKVGPLPDVQLEELLENNMLVLLDQVSDPHNLGAVLRSCAAFDVGGLILPGHNSAPITEATAKAASGALEMVPVVQDVNLNQAIQKLKEHDFWIVGLEGEADQTLSEIDLKSGKIALVCGSEGSGLRKLVRENCDFLAKLPISQQMESLNVSVAAGIALYEVNQQQTYDGV